MPELYQVIADRPAACPCGQPNYKLFGSTWACVTCDPGTESKVSYPFDELRQALKQNTAPAIYIPASWTRAADLIIRRHEYQQAHKYPDRVTFYSHMGIAAARRYSKAGGGWRLYALAKALDPQGLGMVKRDDLSEFVLSLGVQIRTFNRWMKEGRNAGLFSDVQTKAGEWRLLLVNAGAAGLALNCANVGRRVTMKATQLIGTGWKARVEAAYMETHKGRPIARGTIQKLLNVPVSTQRYRDAQSKIERTPNYAQSNIPADQLAGMKENTTRKGLFVAGNKFIYWRLPNSYKADFAMIGSKGRTRKANKLIRTMQSLDGLFIKQQALSFDSDNSALVKLFYERPEQADKALRKAGRSDKRMPAEVYSQDHRTRGGQFLDRSSRSVIWTHCPA